METLTRNSKTHGQVRRLGLFFAFALLLLSSTAAADHIDHEFDDFVMVEKPEVNQQKEGEVNLKSTGKVEADFPHCKGSDVEVFVCQQKSLKMKLKSAQEGVKTSGVALKKAQAERKDVNQVFHRKKASLKDHEIEEASLMVKDAKKKVTEIEEKLNTIFSNNVDLAVQAKTYYFNVNNPEIIQSQYDAILKQEKESQDKLKKMDVAIKGKGDELHADYKEYEEMSAKLLGLPTWKVWKLVPAEKKVFAKEKAVKKQEEDYHKMKKERDEYEESMTSLSDTERRLWTQWVLFARTSATQKEAAEVLGRLIKARESTPWTDFSRMKQLNDGIEEQSKTLQSAIANLEVAQKLLDAAADMHKAKRLKKGLEAVVGA